MKKNASDIYINSFRAILDNTSVKGRITGFLPISSGFANKNFKLITEYETVLCRFVYQKSIAKLEEEIELLLFLKKKGFPAAYPVSKKDGSFISLLDDGTPVVLYDFLEGNEPEPNPVTASETGCAAGILNAMPFEKWAARKNDLSLVKCRELISHFTGADNRLRPLLDEFTAETKLLSDALSTDLPAGIVHGDLYPDNTIFSGNKLVGILDFEEFCVDTLLFDAGNAIQGFCYPGKKLDVACLSAFLKSYHHQRPFTDSEIEMLPWYIRWGAHSQVSWHLRYGLLSQYNDRQYNRAMELMQRIVQLRKVMAKLEKEVKKAISR